MRITLVRSSTLLIDHGGNRLLFDPYLAAKGAGKSYAGQRVSPLVDLPFPIGHALDGVNAVLVSHLHSDHFDDAAREALPKAWPILCHLRDADQIRRWGFTEVVGFEGTLSWRGLEVSTTAGRHGPPEVLDDLGEVAGFVLRHPDEPTLYLAGDTILCDEVRAALAAHSPDVAVLHAAGAAWRGHGPIIMDEAQVGEVLRIAPEAQVLATHLDAVDHGTVSRASLRAFASTLPQTAAARLMIPDDGERLSFER